MQCLSLGASVNEWTKVAWEWEAKITLISPSDASSYKNYCIASKVLNSLHYWGKEPDSYILSHVWRQG